jgi:hypothetical protein
MPGRALRFTLRCDSSHRRRINCDSAINDEQQAVSTQNVAIGTFIGGGVAVIAGIIMYAVGGNVVATRRASMKLAPFMGRNVGGLGLSGSF